MKQQTLFGFFDSGAQEKVEENRKRKSDTETVVSEKKRVKTKIEEKNESQVNFEIKEPKKKKPASTKFMSQAFNPLEDGGWKPSERTPYSALANVFSKVEKESSRLKIIELLTNLFRSVILLSPEDLLPCVYLTVNRLAPEYEGLELGVGESLLMKAISEATGKNMASLKISYDEKGDLGLIAQESRSTQRTLFAPEKLTLKGVFEKLKSIASLQGHSSTNKKKDMIRSLLVACREDEAKYIIRSLQGKLRIGLAEKSVLSALAHAFILTPPPFEGQPRIIDQSYFLDTGELEANMNKAHETLASVYSELPNYDVIIPTLLKYGIEKLPDHCSLTPGIPVHPMLAQPSKSIDDVLHRLKNMTFSCEWKYDGERAQIHYLEGGDIKIFSRNLENNTAKFPDLVQILRNAIQPGVTSFIIDSEVVAFDKQEKKILPFQILSTRARKGVELKDIKVQVCLFGFDLLFLNGKSLLRETFSFRRNQLQASFREVDGEFSFVKYHDTSNVLEIQEFLQEAVKGNCEGLIVKTLEKNATYTPSERSYNWLKVKKDYLEGMGDSLDLVVIGGYTGRGKRTGVYGGYLLACYDQDSETYQSICKIGTGFSDEDLQNHSSFLRNHIIGAPRSYYQYGEGVKPDVWFEPVQVWEIMTADLSISPQHKAAIGLVDPSKGIALRFPRFVRVREDKKPEEATTSNQVAELFRNQNINHQRREVEEFQKFPYLLY